MASLMALECSPVLRFDGVYLVREAMACVLSGAGKEANLAVSVTVVVSWDMELNEKRKVENYDKHIAELASTSLLKIIYKALERFENDIFVTFRLQRYIYDYMIRKNMHSSAEAFKIEVDIPIGLVGNVLHGV
ncbi:hypothetical protein J5N97_024897 [Dioscorea zingiberensis]|uniref:Uncharacterized protein n=1 Tax=Dioscorea zingiberensis TaxID=325984 RepID=A0A9D5H9D2_9LILI|nr:hypothetical protein J5N97_024897 [Dioscorea zingiberensis]